MDCKPDLTVINQENQDLDFCFDFCVKVENNIEWPIQPALAPSEKYHNEVIYEEFGPNSLKTDWTINNLASKENYQDESYASNKNYQENINYKQIKQDFETFDSSLLVPDKKFQDKITYYEDLKEESSQTCMLCGKYFLDSYSLLQHNVTHLRVPLMNKKVFICEHCPKYYNNKTNLENHILINHVREYNQRIPITKQRRECLICKKTYSYKHWYDHMKEVHSKTKFKCKECNVLLKCERNLKQHYKYVHKGVKRRKHAKTKCPKCPAIVVGNALAEHIRNCHSNETYMCHLCNSKLKCKAYLRGHMKRVHYNDGMLHACEICGKEFKSKMYVKVHIKNSHSKNKL
ncbi:zinc finger and BTB domain-containing protein 41-like isoform X1 [Maniola jurtina]|uniref:zinc finger and BTB domain-containing protein 41-like isoform X1 n=1 Tax=Maniola jurtina TaxID=191418 RepID=UPI001E68CE8D|nr:zinc finger and BTB domain-containing protein 41-like isoform X1 [Maniola jurtina]